MKQIRGRVLSIISLLFLPFLVFASDAAISLVGVQGYDLVSYHQKNGPVRGSGNHTAYHNGVAYLFATDENKKVFQANPEKYLPAYGGYCAFAVSVGRKVVSDPLAWKIVDGILYLNLNKQVQEFWSKDIPGNIKKGNIQWEKIKDIDPQKI
ncbi:TPA: YHS domain-containing protein [Legionella pneumophila]|uniref:YHS domain-containing protein n=1 Tax=Legionella pneumophila TaxID=446 RepID=A0A2S6EYY1_LEGPN|nr:YHS domain-containing (seleno)protein [Legionella pneumophila]APF02933.1 YHS domain protein [Legionella pneumophila subsp. fraseri]APF05963.1 YHS domain protein [Legionella pneumophila subsp. fraseri]AUB68422.1 YHS domain protein [Legionella pneumophila]AUB71395.1 YHS domain protein [Legionella pneumophila]KXB24138.1 YHS domain protein [Legionella pneumophila]